MKDYIYRIYGQSKEKGWEVVDTKTDKEEAICMPNF